MSLFLLGLMFGVVLTAYWFHDHGETAKPGDVSVRENPRVAVSEFTKFAVDQIANASFSGADKALTSMHINRPCAACDLWRKNFLLEHFPEERDRIMREVLREKVSA